MKDESIFLVLFFVTAIASWLVFPARDPESAATGAAESSGDRCHDPRLEAGWRQALDRANGDPRLLENRALRLGLCQMLERGEIDSRQAAAIWNAKSPARTIPTDAF